MEKLDSNFTYRMIQSIVNLLRFVEMFVFFLAISKFSSQLPSIVHVSTDYFRRISFNCVISPKLVFVIGNVIVLILFIKSRIDDIDDGVGDGDLCYEYVKSYDVSVIDCATVSDVIVDCNKRRICRSKSENRMKMKCGGGETHRRLRRSVTELSRSTVGDGGGGDGDGGGGGAVAVDGGDKLSCNEFRRRVEEFIARQQKMLRDEEFSPMVYIGS